MICSNLRSLNSILLHANNLIGIVEREELLTLPAAILHASVVLFVLFADFGPHKAAVHADIDSSQSVDAIGFVPSACVTTFGNATTGTHVGGCDILAFLSGDLANAPNFEPIVPDSGRGAGSEEGENKFLGLHFCRVLILVFGDFC